MTIEHIHKEVNMSLSENKGTYVGYRYYVTFTDEKSEQRLGMSEVFREESLLENGEKVMAYYRPVPSSDEVVDEIVDTILDGIGDTLFSKNLERYKEPEFEVHFCDRSVYKLEEKGAENTKRTMYIFGVAFIAVAFIILFFGHKK